MNTDRLFAWLLGASLFVHLAAGVYSAMQPYQPPEFAMIERDQSLDVAFVELADARPPEPVVEPQPVAQPVLQPEPEPEAPEEMVESDPPPPPPPAPPPVAEPAPETAVVAPEPAPVVVAAAEPDYLRNPPPPYPRLARQRRWEGTAILRVEVLPSGLPGHIEIRESSGYRRLDEVSVEAVRGWKFRPARRGDQAVASWVEVPIDFRLRPS